MSRPVRARRLTPGEGRCLLRLVRRGRHDSVRYRRALIIMASASGTPVPAIARLVAADPDTVRDVIHAFNGRGLVMLAPRWGGGRPRRITDADVTVIVATAKTRPRRLGLPFTHWSLRKLAGYLSGRYGRHDPHLVPARPVRIGRDRVRVILHEHGSSVQRTRTWKPHLEAAPGSRTWKTSADPAYDAKLDRIDAVMSRFPDRVFGFDQFGRLSIRPCHGTCWAAKRHPDRLRATYHRAHGIRYFPGCYSRAEDRLWGVLHEHKGGPHSPAAFKTIRAARPDGAPIYIVCDNLSVNTTPGHPQMGRRAQRRVVPDPDQRILGQPDRGAVRTAAHGHHGQLRPPQPRSAGPGPARLPALAQRQQPPPRRAGRRAPRTRPCAKRTPPPLGPPSPTPSRPTKPA